MNTIEERQRRTDEGWKAHERFREGMRFVGIEPTKPLPPPDVFLEPAPMERFDVSIENYHNGVKTIHSYTVYADDQTHADFIALEKHRSVPKRVCFVVPANTETCHGPEAKP